jgi:hypothetical protein
MNGLFESKIRELINITTLEFHRDFLPRMSARKHFVLRGSRCEVYLKTEGLEKLISLLVEDGETDRAYDLRQHTSSIDVSAS